MCEMVHRLTNLMRGVVTIHVGALADPEVMKHLQRFFTEYRDGT